MRERADESRTLLYVLLEANRWIVTAGVVLFVFAFLVSVAVLSPVELRVLAERADPVGTLFQALVTSIITGVTLVVTITQLVISQELGPVGDQRERMDGAMSFRADAEEYLDEPVSPMEPAAFMRELLESILARADDLSAASESAPDPARSRVESLVEDLVADATRIVDRLADAEFGHYEVVSAALDFNYSQKIYDGRRLRQQHGEDLPEPASEALDDVVAILVLFAPSREHVKTLYFQWELTNLSREILYLTVPALVVSMAGVIFLDAPSTVTGTTLGVDNLVWVVCAAATVAVAPFALLLSYILRIATVAKRTLAIGPFVLRSLDESAGVDWDDRD